MSIKDKIEQDIKQAMLGGDKTLTETLRGLKNAIVNVEIAKGQRESGISDPEVIEVLGKEAKKRQESADLYRRGGNEARATAELAEKSVIEKYLPAQLDEATVKEVVDSVVQELGASSIQQMGQVIGQVRERTKGQADGAVIARLVKEKLQ